MNCNQCTNEQNIKNQLIQTRLEANLANQCRGNYFVHIINSLHVRETVSEYDTQSDLSTGETVRRNSRADEIYL